MKKFANLDRRELEFIEGDYVFLELRPYRWLYLAQKRCEKLAPKFCGPCEILQCIGVVT